MGLIPKLDSRTSGSSPLSSVTSHYSSAGFVIKPSHVLEQKEEVLNMTLAPWAWSGMIPGDLGSMFTPNGVYESVNKYFLSACQALWSQ